MRHRPEVDDFEEDMELDQIIEVEPVKPSCGKFSANINFDLWGLGRLTHPDYKPLSYSLNYNYEKFVPVWIYVLDTGIRIDHEEFENRALWGYTVPQVADID